MAVIHHCHATSSSPSSNPYGVINTHISYSFPRSQHFHSGFILYLLPTVLLLMSISSLPFGCYSSPCDETRRYRWRLVMAHVPVRGCRNVKHQFWSWAVSREIMSTTCSNVVGTRVRTFLSFRFFFTDTLFFSSPSAWISPPLVNTHHSGCQCAHAKALFSFKIQLRRMT